MKRGNLYIAHTLKSGKSYGTLVAYEIANAKGNIDDSSLNYIERYKFRKCSDALPVDGDVEKFPLMCVEDVHCMYIRPSEFEMALGRGIIVDLQCSTID